MEPSHTHTCFAQKGFPGQSLLRRLDELEAKHRDLFPVPRLGCGQQGLGVMSEGRLAHPFSEVAQRKEKTVSLSAPQKKACL